MGFGGWGAGRPGPARRQGVRRHGVRRHGVILLYHRVGAPDCDPLSLFVSPENFAAQLRQLSKTVDVVPLDAVQQPTPSRRVAITFDDGYRDNLAVAAPILAGGGTPATFFVTTDPLGTPREYWWDRLWHLLIEHRPPSRLVEFEGIRARIHLQLGSPQAGRRAFDLINRQMLEMSPAEIEQVMSRISDALGVSTEPCPAHDRLSESDVRELANGFEIGAHTRSHPRLTRLPDDAAFDEISSCRMKIAALTGRLPSALAYPYGSAGTVGDRHVAMARTAGFDRACLNVRGTVGPRTDGHRLPRMIVQNWDGPEFGRRLDQWFRDGR